MTLNHPEAGSYTVTGLEEFVEYEIFVQPYNEASIVGLPSALQLVRTHPSHPSEAPIILEAKMINASAAFVAWTPLGEDQHNGHLLGYKASFWAQKSHFPQFHSVGKHFLMYSTVPNKRVYPAIYFGKKIHSTRAY